MGAGGEKTQEESRKNSNSKAGTLWFDQHSPWQSSQLCKHSNAPLEIAIQRQGIALHIPSKSFQRAKLERKD